MRGFNYVIVGAALAASAMPGFGAATAARVAADPAAIGGTYAVNGTYTAVSDGQWAKTRESYHDEATITNTWTITSMCANAYECSGQVTSDQGWRADLQYISGLWYVSRELPNWAPCPDGTAAAGHQTFKFYTLDETTLVGTDYTVGPSGACGKNLPLWIEMPFKLTKTP
jgi:hypothetical protein